MNDIFPKQRIPWKKKEVKKKPYLISAAYMTEANSFFFGALWPKNFTIFLVVFAWDGAFSFPFDFAGDSSLSFSCWVIYFEIKGTSAVLQVAKACCLIDKFYVELHAPVLRRMKGINDPFAR